MIDRRLFIAAVPLILGGCTTMKQASGGRYARVVDTAQTIAILSDQYQQCKVNYGLLKQASISNRDLFSDQDWQGLVAVDQEFIDADGAITDLLEKDNSLSLKAMQVQQVLDIVRPLDRACQTAIDIYNPIVRNFPGPAFDAYVDARGGYSIVKRRVKQLKEDEKIVNAGSLALEIVGVVGGVLGTAGKILLRV